MDSDHAYRKDLSHTTWADVWARQEARGSLAAEYARLAGIKSGSRVLEVGCGPGYFALAYARIVGPSGLVTAIDVSSEALDFLAARAAAHRNVRTLLADAHRPLSVEPHDVALVTDVLHHADDPTAVLRNVAQVASRLVVAEFDPSGDPHFGPPLSERLAESDVTRLLAAARWSVTERRALAWDHYSLAARRS